MLRRLIVVLLFILMLTSLVMAENSTDKVMIVPLDITDKGGSVSLPVVSGINDAELLEKVNAALQKAGQFVEYRQLISQAVTGTQTVASYRVALHETPEGKPFLSVLFSVEGRLLTGVTGHHMTSCHIDLSTGKPFDLVSYLFGNQQGFQDFMTAYLDEHITQNLSVFIDKDALTPIPTDGLYLSGTRLECYWPTNRAQFLSGRPFGVALLRQELPGAASDKSPVDKASLLSVLDSGILPDLPIDYEKNRDDYRQAYGLAHDPDYFPGADKLVLEDPRFRGTALLFKGDSLLGFVSQRFAVAGIVHGQSSRVDIEAALGEASGVLDLTDDAAELYGFSPDTLHTYHLNKYDVSFNYDSDDIVRTLWVETRGKDGNS